MNVNKKIYKKRAGAATFEEREKALFADFAGNCDSLKYKVKNMDKAKQIITEHLDGIIRVYGDYDTDGMTSLAEFKTMLEPLMPADADYYAPRRRSDGYGANKAVLETWLPDLALDDNKGKPALFITVDNGIAAFDAVAYAKERGYKVLIIDHHLPATDDNGNIKVPNADLIVDPHYTGESDFVDYCAAGLVLKLAQEFYGDDEDDSLMKKIHSFAAIGTVGDSVSFIEKVNGHMAYDNYLIVKTGLKTLIQNDGTTTGLYCLLRAINKEYSISETDIGFQLSPVMNAMSRMEDDGAQIVFDLITRTSDFGACDILAQKCISANADRKDFTDAAIPILCAKIDDGHVDDFPIVVTAAEGEVHPGIVGLLANKIAEKYNSMVIVLLEHKEDGTYSGSGRAPEGSDLKTALDASKQWLGKYGGHKAAAGVSLPMEKLDDFTKCIQSYCGNKPEELYSRYYDYEISEDEVAEQIAIAKKYAPFGMGHTLPVYKVKMKCAGRFPYNLMGPKSNMLKLNGRKIKGVNFTGTALEQLKECGLYVPMGAQPMPFEVTVYGTLNENVYMGQVTNQIMINDLEHIESTL